MRRMGWFYAVGFALVPLCGMAQQAAGNDGHAGAAGQGGNPPVSIRTQANLVLLDVVVTQDGKPVHGLTQDKFHVQDNGVGQQVTVFEEHRPPPAVAAAPKPLALGPDTYSNLAEYPPGSAVNVLLLDGLNTPVADQMYARRQMLEYLKNIPAGTGIAVFTLASRLRMLEGFTTDASALAEIVEGKRKGTAQESALIDQQFDQETAGQSNVLGGLGASPEVTASYQQFQADMAMLQTDIRVQMTLDALQSLARYLSPIPVRKNLIWFSGSFPLSLEPDPSVANPLQAVNNYAEQVRLTDGMLSAARVAVYPVDARGLMLPPSALASNSYQSNSLGLPSSGVASSRGRRGTSGNASSSAAGVKASASEGKFTQNTAQEHATMQQIAEETGGEAFLDTNGIKEAVARAVANGSSYYTIGYAPSLSGYDGSFHRLKVLVDGQYKAEYRQGYFADDVAKARTNPTAAQHLMAAALEQGAPPVSEILFKARVLPASAAAAKAAGTPGSTAKTDAAGAVAGKGPVRRYAVDYGVPAHSLEFLASSDGERHGRLEFVLVAYSPDGKQLNTVDQNANFDLKPEIYTQVLQYGIPMHLEIDLPVGPAFLRIAVHDLNSEHVGATEVPVNVK